MRWGVATWLVVAACSSAGPTRVGDQPSWRRTTEAKAVGPVTFAPASEPAARYNEPVQAPPHTRLGDAVLAAVQSAAAHASLPPPAADARLFRACAELAEIVPEEGVVDYDLVAFALQRNGIIEPSPHLLIAWGDVDSPDQIVAQLQPTFGELLTEGATRIGLGTAKRRADGTSAVVFALQSSGLSTSPIPRSVAAGGSFAIDAVVDARYHDPEVFVTRDDGSVERLALAAGRSGAFKVAMPCAQRRGQQQVEITASNATGSSVLANFPVWCGTEPPLAMNLDATTDDTVAVPPDQAERELLAMLNRDRLAKGLSALVWDDRVAAVARAYSDEMRRTKVVAHISPTSGAATDRLHAAGITSAVVLENVARAYSIKGAHAGLMNSPGHRANLMSPSATHVGIGVVFGDEVSGRRELLVTQVFIRIPPKIDPTQAAELVRQRIARVRPIAVDAKLASVAQHMADALAAGKTRDQLWPSVRGQLDSMGNVYARIGNVIDATAELDTVDGKDLVGDYTPDDIGVGIAQGKHPEIGEHAIWIVVLLAERNDARHPPTPRRK